MYINHLQNQKIFFSCFPNISSRIVEKLYLKIFKIKKGDPQFVKITKYFVSPQTFTTERGTNSELCKTTLCGYLITRNKLFITSDIFDTLPHKN